MNFHQNPQMEAFFNLSDPLGISSGLLLAIGGLHNGCSQSLYIEDLWQGASYYATNWQA